MIFNMTELKIEQIKIGEIYEESYLEGLGLKRTKRVGNRGEIFRHEMGDEIFIVDESTRDNYRIIAYYNINTGEVHRYMNENGK